MGSGDREEAVGRKINLFISMAIVSIFLQSLLR